MTCIFCEIAARRAPAHWLDEDASTFTILTKGPIRPGAAMVVPKAHHGRFVDLPDALRLPGTQR